MKTCKKKKRLSWMVGLGAVGLAVAGWMMPRRKTPMEKMMDWTDENIRKVKKLMK